MNKIISVLFIGVITFLFLGGQAISARESMKGDSKDQAQMRQDMDQKAGERMTQTRGSVQEEYLKEGFLAGKAIGKDAVDKNGEKLGKIVEIVIGDNGRTKYFVLSGRELLGTDIYVPVDYDAADAHVKINQVVMNGLDKQRLLDAPSFIEEEWYRLENPEFEQSVHSYYGKESRSPAEQGGRMIEEHKTPMKQY